MFLGSQRLQNSLTKGSTLIVFKDPSIAQGVFHDHGILESLGKGLRAWCRGVRVYSVGSRVLYYTPPLEP